MYVVITQENMKHNSKTGQSYHLGSKVGYHFVSALHVTTFVSLISAGLALRLYSFW
jgi:hypothetical protein